MSAFSMEPPTFEALTSELSPLKVDRQAIDPLKAAVEFCAICLKQELRFVFTDYLVASHGADVNVEAYVFHEFARDLLDEFEPCVQRVIGACAFHRLHDTRDLWRLQWVWFHPFARHQGHLRTAWPSFEMRYGAFEILAPISPMMALFLNRTKHQYAHEPSESA